MKLNRFLAHPQLNECMFVCIFFNVFAFASVMPAKICGALRNVVVVVVGVIIVVLHEFEGGI